MKDAPEDPRRDSEHKSSFRRASSMLDQLPQTDQEVEALRNAVMTKEGLILSVFDILRKMPRRVLMVFKLNDLTRFDILFTTKPIDNDKLIPCSTEVLITHLLRRIRRLVVSRYLARLFIVRLRFASSLSWPNTALQQFGRMSDNPFLTG